MSLSDLLRSFQGRRAIVLGDLMLDEYIFGKATRISQEAPVMVVRQESTRAVPGGAANVAANIVALGAEVALLGIVGQDAAGQTLRHEASLTLRDEASGDTPLAAALFIPPAARLGLVADCDLEAVRLSLQWLRDNAGDLVVRAALSSMKNPDFLPRLEKMLAAEPDLARRLFLEIDAHGLVELHDTVSHLCRAIARLGTRIGLRRLAQQFGALTYLSGLPIAYVKLGGSFVTELAGSDGSQSLVSQVVDLARGHDIDVWAEDVPDTTTARVLENLGITLMRGPGISPSTNP